MQYTQPIKIYNPSAVKVMIASSQPLRQPPPPHTLDCAYSTFELDVITQFPQEQTILRPQEKLLHTPQIVLPTQLVSVARLERPDRNAAIETMNAKHDLLTVLQRCITAQDFAELSLEAGFQPPNSFSIHRIEEDVKLVRLPVADHYEYAWAIYECSRENLKLLSPPVKVLLSAFFVYCQKQTSWGVPIESEYYQLGLEAIFDGNCSDLSFAYLAFLDWLDAEVRAEQGYDNYFCLLANVYLRAHLGSTAEADARFQSALQTLAVKARSISEHEITVAENGLNWWRGISVDLVGGEVNRRRLVSVLPSPS